MKIISHNVNYHNRQLATLVGRVFSTSPDIVCFQEFPQTSLSLLPQSDYSCHWTSDADNIRFPQQSMLLVTLISHRYPVVSTSHFDYFSYPHTSVLDRYYYRHICHMAERDQAIEVNTSKFKIINCRLSAATGVTNKHQMLKNILHQVPKTPPTVVCGDFNTTPNLLFRLATGLIRGYSIPELFVPEEPIVNKLITSHDFLNHFRHFGTLSFLGLPSMQLDYILTNSSLVAVNKSLLGTFGSDHQMLFLETK